MLNYKLQNKNSLERKTDKLQEDLVEEIYAMIERFGKVAQIGLIVVGAGAIGYGVTKNMIKRSKKEQPQKNTNLPDKPIAQSLKDVAKSAVISFVLSIAKDKLVDLLEAKEDEKKKSS